MTDESLKKRAEIVALRNRRLSWRQIGLIVGMEFQNAHGLFHKNPSQSNRPTYADV
jgi:hypothetical protein